MIEPDTNPFDPSLALPAPATGGQPARPWLITFADLICVLLSFFVLLANISKVEDQKARDALYSLGETLNFGTPGTVSRFAPPPESEALTGPRIVRERLATRIRELFPKVRLTEIPARNELHFALARAAVFDGEAIKPGAKTALTDLAATLKRAASGYHFVAQVTTGPGANLRSSEAQISRLARTLVDLGAPKRAVAAGIDSGDAADIRFAVRAEPDDAPRIDFRKVMPE